MPIVPPNELEIKKLKWRGMAENRGSSARPRGRLASEMATVLDSGKYCVVSLSNGSLRRRQVFSWQDNCKGGSKEAQPSLGSQKLW